MVDRAHALARTLLARLTNLHAGFAEDRRGAPDRAQRIAAIEKVLAVELGVTDAATLAAIEAAAPSCDPARRVTASESAEFAGFLRQRLRAELSDD